MSSKILCNRVDRLAVGLVFLTLFTPTYLIPAPGSAPAARDARASHGDLRVSRQARILGASRHAQVVSSRAGSADRAGDRRESSEPSFVAPAGLFPGAPGGAFGAEWFGVGNALLFPARNVVASGQPTSPHPNTACPPGGDCWVGGASGKWSVATNWSGGVPSTGTNVFINNGVTPASAVTLDIYGGAADLSISSGSSLAISNAVTLTISGSSISNAGKLNLSSSGNGTGLIVAAPKVTLSGAGTVNLSNNAQNYIRGSLGANVLDNQTTIEGSGNIGANQMTLVNQALIEANQATPLNVQANGGTTNTGTLEASNGATLILFDTIANSGGNLLASGSGSAIVLNGSTVIGGTLTTASGGVISSQSGATLSGLTNSGTLQVPNANTTVLVGTITNNGSIQMNSSGNGTVFQIAGPSVTLKGTGTLTMSNNSQNYIYGAATGTEQLINQETIQGAGYIGAEFLTLTNQGTIDATWSLNPLVVQPSGTASTNTKVMEATSAGILQIQGTLTNTGGTIQSVGTGPCDSGTCPSQVTLNGATIIGGTLTTSGGGVLYSQDGTILNGLSNTGTVQVPNGTGTVLAETIDNKGAIQLNSFGNGTDLLMQGTVTLSGGGKLQLSDNNQNYLAPAPGGGSLVNVDNTISGSGAIGSGAGTGSMAFTNKGTVDATSTGGNTLVISTLAGTTNTGTLEASSGGKLQLENSINNMSGTIEALAGTGQSAGGTVVLNGAVVGGGTLKTLGTGVNAGAILLEAGATLNAVTNSGTLQEPNGNTAVLVGTINNTGTIQLNSSGNGTDLLMSGAVTLSGAGTLQLSDNNQNYVAPVAAGGSLLNLNEKIVGAGTIGSGANTGSMAFTNQATVDATSSHGNVLTIDTAYTVVNTGTLEASAGGTLVLDNSVNNAGGTIEALAGTSGAGGTVILNGVTVTGGTLTALGSSTKAGVIVSQATSQASTILSGLLINSGTLLEVPNGTNTTLMGTITNNGSMQLNSSGNPTIFEIAGPSVTLKGTGTLTLSNNAQNYIYGVATGTEQFINQETIQGAGQIGSNFLTLTNQGTIDATQYQTPLVVQPSGTASTNTKLMEATNGGILQIEGTLTNSGGTIEAVGTGGVCGSGKCPSQVVLDEGTIIGGTLASSGGGVIYGQGGVTLNTLTNNAAVQVPNGTNAVLVGTITNKGTIALNSSGNGTDLLMSGAVTLTGGGKVTLSNNAQNFIAPTLGGGSLVNVNNTISGAGTIGSGANTGSMAFTNQGTVDAVGGTLLISTLVGATNTATMEASSGGTLEFENRTNNVGGTIEALAGSGSAAGGTVVLNGAAISGGTLTTLGSGTNAGLIVSQSGATLDGSPAGGLTISGSLVIPNGNSTYLKGTITNTKSMTLASSGNGTFLYVNGNVTLNGSGILTLSNNANNTIVGLLGNEVLTNNSTIEGSGNIGGGYMGLVNNGTILANQATTLFVQPDVTGFTNNGTLSVNAGDLLHVSAASGGGFTNFSVSTLTGGTYNVTGTLEIDQLGNTGGEIVNNAADIVLNGNSYSFVDAAGLNALSDLASNTSKGVLSIQGGGSFTTPGNFTNNGTLIVGAGSTFSVPTGSSLVNFSGTKLSGGTYIISGTLQFPGADIVTNGASITLSGGSSKIINQVGSNALANFATNAGNFTITSGRNFTTSGDFTNSGTLTVGSGSTFSTGTNSLTNFSGSTLTGGTYNVTGKLQFDGANIVTNAANITLNGTASEIEDQNGNNALLSFTTNSAGASFALQGSQNLTTTSVGFADASFTNSGLVTVGKGSTFTVGNNGNTSAPVNYTQNAGTTQVDGTLTSTSSTTTPTLNLSGGMLRGAGTLDYAVVNAATITPGDSTTSTGELAVSNTYTQNSGGTLDISIGGTTVGTKFDQLDVSLSAALDGTLDIDLISGFTPTVGETFDILNASSISGMFETVDGATINSMESFSVVYNATDVELDVQATMSPAQSWPAGTPRPSAATPEPGTLVLFGTALFGLVWRLRRFCSLDI